MKQTNVHKLAACAMIAAFYAAVSLSLPMLSYGVVQIPGVTLGCLLTNLAGVAMGTTLLPDVVFGTLATLIAAVMSYQLRGVRVKGLPIASSLPPILVNGLVIGLELTFFYSDGFRLGIFLINAVSVAAGQVIPCAVLGVLLVRLLERGGLQEKLFQRLS